MTIKCPLIRDMDCVKEKCRLWEKKRMPMNECRWLKIKGHAVQYTTMATLINDILET